MHMFSRLASTTSLDDSKYTTVHTHSLVVSQNLYLWRFAFVLNLSVNLSISNTVAFKLWRKKKYKPFAYCWLAHKVSFFSQVEKQHTHNFIDVSFCFRVSFVCSMEIQFTYLFVPNVVLFLYFIYFSNLNFDVFFSIWFLFCWMNTQHQNMTFKFHRSSIEYHTWMCIAQRSSIHV